MKPNNSKEPNIGLEKIRQAGICNHYEQLKNKGLSPRVCLTKTAEFARISERQAKGILTGNVQPTGKKVFPFIKYLYEIEMVEAAITISKNLEKVRSLERIHDDIRNDDNLNDDEKQILESQLEQLSQKIKELPPTQKTSSPTP